MNRILIVSQSEGAANGIAELLTGQGAAISFAHTAADAREKLKAYLYELVIINAPLTDLPAAELAESIVSAADSVVMLLLLKEEYTALQISELEGRGIVVLEKPISRAVLSGALSVIRSMQNRVSTIISENSDLRARLTEQKLVNRAKLTLMQYLGMSEQGAHRHIERQAMDLRMTKRQIAENILRIYEQ